MRVNSIVQLPGAKSERYFTNRKRLSGFRQDVPPEIARIVGEIYSRYPFDASAVTFFGLDEVTNVPRDYAGACYTMLKTEIIDALGIKDENFLMLPTVSDDFGRDCIAFQEEIAKRAVSTWLILGLGENGHLGFNQPQAPFDGEHGLLR